EPVCIADPLRRNLQRKGSRKRQVTGGDHPHVVPELYQILGGLAHAHRANGVVGRKETGEDQDTHAPRLPISSAIRAAAVPPPYTPADRCCPISASRESRRSAGSSGNCASGTRRFQPISTSSTHSVSSRTVRQGTR